MRDARLSPTKALIGCGAYNTPDERANWCIMAQLSTGMTIALTLNLN